MDTEEKLKAVGEKIKLMRISKDLQQKELAQKVGLSQACLSNIEAGRYSCTLRNLFAIQKVFGCKMEDFFVTVDEEKTSQAAMPESELKLDDLYDLLALVRRKKRL